MQNSTLALPATDEPDVTAALCHELELPLAHLMARIDRAHELLRRRRVPVMDQSMLQLAHCLADAHDTAQHLARVIADVTGFAHGDRRPSRPLDLRVAVRAAAAMAQRPDGGAADIAVDAPAPAWVDGVDTRLVHVFVTLFTEALADEHGLVVHVGTVDGEIVTELRWSVSERHAARGACPSLPARSPALGRALVHHIVAAHGGHLEHWPTAGAGVAARVTLPLARRMRSIADE